ncbi:kinase-like domain-containing protein [Staphylotrichum tortipilum]|uniref:Kinase-like domain-containing protein n=1 Tax=Staphylotrichum tortipilum TaxID=2831512 RepID=A0AAN6RU82_9PEZI|nr:kinase-like domain-containing protein [Staphylotrichum longicolle]
MAHPRSVELISEEILKEMSGTEYACSSLEPLSGGYLNFVFRGILITPLSDGTQEVAVKHGENFVVRWPESYLSTTRCRAEGACLETFHGLPPTTSGAYIIRTPTLHYFNAESNTQVHEYFANALSLKDYIGRHFSPSGDPSMKTLYIELGRDLGVWLRNFHGWASAPEQTKLRRDMSEGNKEMQQLKYRAYYIRLVEAVAEFPTILADAKETFEKIREMAADELQNPNLQLIHGDFWAGNILLPDQRLSEYGEQRPIFVVDWELCQLGVLSLDLGHMIAELYKFWVFKGMNEGRWVIDGFAMGYGYIDDDFAFRTALHAGAHLVVTGTWISGWGSETQGLHVVGVGKEMILRAWHKDRAWFEAGDLACLFGNCDTYLGN